MAADRIYLRTLVFSVALVVLCISGIALTKLPVLQPFSLLLLTSSVGVFCVVVNMIVTVYRYSRALAAAQNNALTNMPTDTCPDFWTQSADGSSCSNTYSTPDGKYKYTIGPKSGAKSVALGTKLADACAQLSTDYPWMYLRARCEGMRVWGTTPQTPPAPACSPSRA